MASKKRAGRTPRLGFLAIEPRVDARPDKLAEIVARGIVHDLLGRHLQQGDPLDSEPAMVERFGVSRESLREGVRLLEVAGLVKIRRGPGGGTFVGSVDPTNLGRFESLYFHTAGATYAELFEAYTVAETLLAERAARHPERERRVDVMTPFLSESYDEPDLAHYIDHHAGFHAAVAMLARNRVLQITMQSLGLLAGRHYVALAERKALTLDAARQSRVFVEDDHHAIAAAIIAGQPHRARDLMVAHSERVISVLLADGIDPDAVVEWV
jgi:DNA-binding FadR family transcriptional regulator